MAVSIVPRSKPGMTLGDAQELLMRHNMLDPVALIGIRGYYLDTMGVPGKNDRGIYDDCICLVGPNIFQTCNANTDPSVARKAIAVLEPGVWMYKIGIHGLSKPKDRQYKALVQAAEVTVVRDDVGRAIGWFGINIHRGSFRTTSSLGCQTIYPPQWQDFIGQVEHAMKAVAQKRIRYLLIDESTRRLAA